MRAVTYASAFKKDFKRELKGQHRKTVEADLLALSTYLRNDQPLPEKNKDHPLTGEWTDHRDCHVKPDLVLIYRKFGGVDDELQLVRLGSHSELDL